MKRIFTLIMVLMIGIMPVVGCGQKGIEGTWVLTEEIDSAGVKTDAQGLKDLGIAETYVISGDQVLYTLEMDSSSKPIEIEFVLEELGNNKYNFNLSSGLNFVSSAEVKGNTMTYEVGEGDSYSKMVFKRK